MINKLRFFCQRVLPIVYDDSLSFTELLYKVICRMNQIIPVVNNIPEEINNILNQWLEDGTLDQIIKEMVFDVVTPQQYDAKADGVTDDTAAFKAAKDSGKVVLIPKGNYKLTEPVNFGADLIADYGTYTDYMPLYKHEVNVIMGSFTTEQTVSLPNPESYEEGITYLNNNYYVGMYEYNIADNYCELIKYDKDFNQLSIKNIGSTYGRINTLWNDGQNIFADFDSGIHVKFDSNLNVIRSWTNHEYRNFGYYNKQYYGIKFSGANITVTEFDNNLSTAGNSFTVVSPKTEVLQSTTIFNGVIYVPTTNGNVRCIDISTHELTIIPYESMMEIESFFGYGDELRAAGHIVGINGSFNILLDKGTGSQHVITAWIDAEKTSMNPAIPYRTGIYKVYNGSRSAYNPYPSDEGTYISLYDYRLFISSDGMIYDGRSNNFTYIGRMDTDSVHVLGASNYGLVIQAPGSGGIGLYCGGLVLNESNKTYNYDLSSFYQKYGIASNRVLHGKLLGHPDIPVDQLVTADVYVITVRVYVTGIQLIVSNATNPGTINNCIIWDYCSLL